MQRIRVKRGSTLSGAAVRKLAGTDTRVDLTGYTIDWQVRSGDTLVGAIDVTVTDAAQGEWSWSADTSEWTYGIHRADIRYTLNDVVRHTESFEVEVVREVTR